MYKALEIAQYVLDQAKDTQQFVNNFKLNSILYFLQADFLTCEDTPLFEEKIFPRDWGVIIKPVYEKYSFFASNSIYVMEKSYRNQGLISAYDRVKYNIDIETRNRIDKMLKKLFPYGSSQLNDIIKSQTPWKNAYIRSARGYYRWMMESALTETEIVNFFIDDEIKEKKAEKKRSQKRHYNFLYGGDYD